jgi:hypothetical protein
MKVRNQIAAALCLLAVAGMSSTAQAFTVNITNGLTPSIYLRVGNGVYAGTFSSNGTPGSGGGINLVSVAVPAAQLGFAPHSQVGPGGAYDTANKLVANLRAAGYRVPAVAPYNGPGSQMHGSPEQLMEAYRFFAGKTRQ